MDSVEKPEPAAEPEVTPQIAPQAAPQTAPMADVDPTLYEAEEAAFAVAPETDADAPAAEAHPELDAIKEAILEAGGDGDEDAPLDDDFDDDDLDDDFDDEVYDEEAAALDAFAADGELEPAEPPAPETGLQHPAALALWVTTASVVLPLNAAIAGLSLLGALTRSPGSLPAA